MMEILKDEEAFENLICLLLIAGIVAAMVISSLRDNGD